MFPLRGPAEQPPVEVLGRCNKFQNFNFIHDQVRGTGGEAASASSASSRLIYYMYWHNIVLVLLLQFDATSRQAALVRCSGYMLCQHTQ